MVLDFLFFHEVLHLFEEVDHNQRFRKLEQLHSHFQKANSFLDSLHEAFDVPRDE